MTLHTHSYEFANQIRLTCRNKKGGSSCESYFILLERYRRKALLTALAERKELHLGGEAEKELRYYQEGMINAEPPVAKGPHY